MDRLQLEELSSIVERVLCDSEHGAHTIDHVHRVYSIAMTIGKEMAVNSRVLAAAALLHDIGRPQEKTTGVSHSIVSGEMSRGILSRIGYSDTEVEQVVDAIRTHRFSEGLRPVTREGEILSDADRLDAMGAIGIYRAIAEAVASGRGIEGFLAHAEEKLLRLQEHMYTDTGKRMAAERHGLLVSFVNQLKAEYDQSTRPYGPTAAQGTTLSRSLRDSG
ncbi:MAG: HD domain-containing protein [Candidatus Thorarchaeota archaeon]|nr:HD domain-containing protein [Candidatus Thorarchaeota archaeon]